MLCVVKHTKPPKPCKPVSLREAMDRVPGLTQLQLQEASGVDRTRISKLLNADDPDILHTNYEKLDGALRRLGALKSSEKLVFGREAMAS